MVPEMRQVVNVDGRALHMRRLGEGRPVVLLHESPRSSAVLLPLATRLAAQFTVFALDTPGYGSSDPLPLARPEIADFADAIATSLRALGLGRIPVYGTHTGATIAAELGRRHPDLVAGLILDGYPVFTVAERESHHGFYLPSFPPRWDGSHVMALWTRVRDQFDFFPWYALSEDARLRTPKASLDRHRAVLRDFLSAGDSYAVAYAASFRFEALSPLRDSSVPTHVMARDTDLLFSHLERLGPLPATSRVGVLPTELDAWAAAIGRLFGEMAGDAVPPARHDLLDRAPTGIKGVFDGRLLCRCYGPADAPAAAPVLLLHDTPGSAREWHDVATRLATGRVVVVPELPGHGRSADVPLEADDLAPLDDLLGRLIDHLGPKVALVGRGTGALLGAWLARGEVAAIDRLVQVEATTTDDRRPPGPLDPPLPERWDGADLVADWFEARDRALYGPHCDARTGAAPLAEIGFDLDAIHERFRSRVMAGGQDRRFEQALRRAMAGRPASVVQTMQLDGPRRAWASDSRLAASIAPPRLADRIRAALEA